MFAAARSAKHSEPRLESSIDRLRQQIRAGWTPEERVWRATMAVQKLADLLPHIVGARR